MVDIDPLDDDDRAFLRDAVERHFAETESEVAKELLTEWDDAVNRFGKVMPKDFKRVLKAREAAERDGRDVNEAIMEAAHG
jgi:glutamate synthase (NADPH) large chain